LIAFEEDAGANRSVVFFFSVANQIYVARTLSVYLLGGYLIGALLLWFAGGRKVKQIIRPIDRIAQATKSINTKNLGARIDVGQAKYELKDLASTINDMMDRMQDGYRKQQQFVSDVSHELRTPISVINGYANLLDRWGKEDPVILQEAIDALKNESQNMGDLVEKLLFLARYDRDALKYDMQPIDFSELMDEVGKETEMIDDQHHIVWSVEEQLRILGDANRIKQVARIFVDNAVKYSPPGGEILIRGYREDPYVVLEVEDRGMGISKDQLQPIFERFYRTDESRSKHTGGYGLGLSIAKIIVLQHDGKIRVRSKPGAGSIFAALLPILPTKEKEKR
jgi:signal transduction histidine kinase